MCQLSPGMTTQTLTNKLANSKYLEGDIDSQLEELARGYLHYLTWEHKYKGETFHQIVEEDYGGNLDAAIRGFLYHVFNHIQIGKMGAVLQWVLEKGILLIPEESSILLFKIKMIYRMNSYEELKELIGLSDFVLK
jgi:hypothetical protein